MGENRQASRRSFIKSVTAAAAVSTGPFIHAQQNPKLRVLGTHVTLQEELRLRAQEDLGIEIEFYPDGTSQVLQRAVARPESFDLYEQWSNSVRVLLSSDAIQPIDTSRLLYWDEINSLCKTGRISSDDRIGAGDAPHKILYLNRNGSLAAEPTDRVSFMPYVHNVDSFGYDTAFVEPGIEYETESWTWLLDPKNHGKVAIVNDPSIGIFDLALAAQGSGLLEFGDIGAMTRGEVDRLFDLVIGLKLDGHFSGFWTSVPESVRFMQSGRVHIESMFSPAISSLRGQGVNVRYAAPKEGYRGWLGVMSLSSRTEGRRKEMAYEYMNWWLSGWPGAYIARQGYYISNPQRSKNLMTPEEWNYWYEGQPAAIDLTGTDHQVSVLAGEVRSGGSYTRRFSNIAVWNTVMSTYEYSLQRWYELLSV